MVGTSNVGVLSGTITSGTTENIKISSTKISGLSKKFKINKKKKINKINKKNNQ